MKIAVIATGALSALGDFPQSGWDTLVQGERKLVPLTLFDPMTDRSPLVGQITTTLLESHFSRTETLSHLVAKQVLEGVDLGNLRLGITVATTVGGVDHTEQFYRDYLDNPDLISQVSQECIHHEPSAIAGSLGKRFGAIGVHTLSTACSTGIHGIGMGAEMIRQGVYDVVLAVGVDALSLLTFRGFDSLLLIDYEGARPFDRDRLGISLGEAAGALLLASPKAAEQLHMPAKAYVSGWGASADAYHMTAPHPEGNGAFSSAKMAIERAGIIPDEVDWICAHGTGTPDNDRAEIAAMKRLFSEIPPFVSFKGAMGHTLAASGTVESVYAIESFKTDFIPRSAGFTSVDPEINSSPSQGESRSISHILKNSFGFGGNNGSLVLSRGDL